MQKKLVVAIAAALLTASCASTTPGQSTAATSPLNTQTQQADSLATAQGTAELTMEQIMADPDWLGRAPENAYWSLDSEAVFYQQKRAASVVKDLYRQPLNGAAASAVNLADLHRVAYDGGLRSHDGRFVAYTFEGNVFVYDNMQQQTRQLTRDAARQSELQFLNDGRIAYQQGDGIFAVDVTSGAIEQLAAWQFAEQQPAVAEAKDFVAREAIQLSKFLQSERHNRQARADQQQALAQANRSLMSNEFYLGNDQQLVQASISPNADRLIIVTRDKQSWRDDGDIMPNYINEDGRISAEKVRRRVADAKPENHRVILINLEDGSQSTLTYNSLPGWNDDVLADVKRENYKAQGKTYQSEKAPRAITLMQDWGWEKGPIRWNQRGSEVAMMLEAWDNKDRWIVTVDFDAKQFRVQDRLHDDAWINYTHNDFGWLNSDDALWYQSEQSGYSQLYVKPLAGSERALTQGRFVVESPTLSPDGEYLYFQANKKHPGVYEVYRVAVDGGEVEQLTNLGGINDYRLSPNGKQLLLTHSSALQPPELMVQAVAANAQAQQLTHTTSEKFESIDWTAPSVVAIPSSHGEHPIYSRLYLPDDFDPNRAEQYPAVVFIHGAGYLQNAHMGWSGYFREFMFHSLLNKHGYVVLDVDYRGSKGYGRDWRTAIYRQMGTPEVEDLVDAVNWLGNNSHVDTQRVGTYGGSYGGFLTFMALFKEPGLFQAGAALRPVSDWAHYNTGYTANILNLPDDDAIAYRRSSPIYFADGLEDALLINSPMVDDNVFFQDSVRVVQRLIELQKEDWETAIYPVEPHGFRQPSSWLNEYRRIFKLFEENLKSDTTQ
ncbi:prolyl oligopeptidase family serine peptidase [Idiomarina xiamenensis]|uniref:Acyl-peptide hydrolase n=1 Tax=Idiomarina xiamenensis 10-D-4 TaxID=740709 RepID=K2KDG7_9GAMM|nr:prolyl oligopeptidase family serine peptidase [Idiomarina xiamenensis]EKE84752.1 dipeptidyl peptidase IV [Idiomarina xiamenensis 10-D-4]